MATARSEDKLSQIAAELNEERETVFVYPGDVTNKSQMRTIAEEITKVHGSIDVLIANAGSHVFTRPLEFNADEYRDLMNLNYGGMLNSIEAALPMMLEKNSGTLVGMSSLAGFRGLPRAAAYGASKAAMTHFLESIRFHLSPKNVNVVIVHPGFVKTPLTDKNDFQMPFLVSSERAAELILDGIRKGKKEISFPVPFNWFMKLMRIIPYGLYQTLVSQLWKRMK